MYSLCLFVIDSEFIKYVSVSATQFIHNITIVTTHGKRYECGYSKSAQIIQFKPPSTCGVLAFYGSVTHKGLSSIGVYCVRNEKMKLKTATKKGIEEAHQRAQMRIVLKGRLKKGISMEDAIGFILEAFDSLSVRSFCEATDKDFVTQVINKCNQNCKPTHDIARKRNRSFLNFNFLKSNK